MPILWMSRRYYNWLTSEYIVNGLTDWVKGGEFALAVSEQLAEQGYEIPAHEIQGGLAADNARSMLTLSLTHGDPRCAGGDNGWCYCCFGC